LWQELLPFLPYQGFDGIKKQKLIKKGKTESTFCFYIHAIIQQQAILPRQQVRQ
jgi:hypothetical protein